MSDKSIDTTASQDTGFIGIDYPLALSSLKDTISVGTVKRHAASTVKAK